ncbi:LytR/AlgR family response regulator transcription factor [Maribellus mangrovi]|uniref:LytR/AlgR family response regulator transcription factor n=1 Tax=Maribellus mangrovi TaxID=3133146 RepID=UPI0030EC8A13
MYCIAIDDEPRALEIIEKYVGKIDFLNLATTFRDPIEAIDYLMKHNIDLIFLDINMPGIFGTELVKVLKNSPMIIFTTAYSEYAIESYELDAVDYLLKPFEFERFLKSVIKAQELKKLKHEKSKTQIVKSSSVDTKILIKSGSEIHQVNIDDIIYIEGLGNYATIHTNNEKIVTYKSLGDVLDLLPAKLFVRIHKSYIVAIQHIKSYEVHQVKIEGKTLPIGKIYRKEFIELMKIQN